MKKKSIIMIGILVMMMGTTIGQCSEKPERSFDSSSQILINKKQKLIELKKAAKKEMFASMLDGFIPDYRKAKTTIS